MLGQSVQSLIIKVLDYYQGLIDNQTINTIYVSTFQVSNADPYILTHSYTWLDWT
jgi:hypothetical protein